MKTIQTTATVTPDGTLTLRVPADVPPGEHQVVIVIEETPREPVQGPALDLPVIHVEKWPENLSPQRADRSVSDDATRHPIEGSEAEGEAPPAGFPTHDVGRWPKGLSLRREDMYDDWGR